MFERLTSGVAVLLLTGCASFIPYPTPDMSLPAQWPQQAVLVAQADSAHDWRRWWQSFGDPELDRLVERAQAGNDDVRLQMARVEEARARLGLARAEQWPSVGVQADAARLRQAGETLGLGDARGPVRNNFSLAGLLGYELDLWGRLARERDAAEALLNENLFVRDALRLAVITDVVTTYFNLRSAQLQQDIVSETLQTREEARRIEQIRFEAGETDELTYSQARSELATTRAQLPLIEGQVRRLESALGVLVGLDPAELFADRIVSAGKLDALVEPERIPSDLPSELLSRRPDLQAAMAALDAASARVDVAETARLPSINLGLLLGATTLQFGDLFSAGAETWNAGASLTTPLFDFGRNRARVETAEAQRTQAAIRYQAVVRNAFAEVRDALSFYDTSGARLEATREQVEVVARTRELAELRYREGSIGMIERLDAQRALLAAELAYAGARSDRLVATATLFKALGGGWVRGDEAQGNGVRGAGAQVDGVHAEGARTAPDEIHGSGAGGGPIQR